MITKSMPFSLTFVNICKLVVWPIASLRTIQQIQCLLNQSLFYRPPDSSKMAQEKIENKKIKWPWS